MPMTCPQGLPNFRQILRSFPGLACVILVRVVLVVIIGRISQKGEVLGHQRAEGDFLQEIQVVSKGLSHKDSDTAKVASF